MRILHSIDELSSLSGPIVLAAGTFDGVHLGHQALIRRALEEASACGGTAVVMTFDRHPALLLRPEKAPKLLTRNDGKIALLAEMGVPALLLLEFTSDLAGVPARDFIASLLAACSPLHAFCVGRQWTFGKGGEGNVALLKELGAERTFEVIQIDPVMAADSPISSTRIRKAIASGDFAESSACLGRPFLLTGKVVSGAGLGATIGFPTANLDVDGMQLPPNGVYAVSVHREGRVYPGVANIGVRPTVDPTSSKRTVEVHLFDVSEDLVGKELSLEFVKFLRGEEKFSGLDALKGQIAKDCVQARAILSS
jgi:riboflavin kinase/FMN adenylyltransferase